MRVTTTGERGKDVRPLARGNLARGKIDERQLSGTWRRTSEATTETR